MTASAPAPLRVLVIDDDEEDFMITRDLFAASDHPPVVAWARDYDSGLEATLSGDHDVCLVDYRLGGDSGIGLMQAARLVVAHVPMILLTGYGSRAVDVAARAAGAQDYLPKNALTSELLERTVRYAVERIRTLAHARELEDKYRLLFDANPVPTWVMDAEAFSYLAVNEAALAQYGYSREEFLQLSAEDIRPEHEHERVRRLRALPIEDFGDQSRWQHQRRDGSVIEVDVSYQQITFEGRRAVIVLARDITERIQGEAAIRQSEERFRELEEHAQVIYFACHPDTLQMQYLSAAYASLFDQPVAEAMQNPTAWMDRVHAQDRSALEAALRKSPVGETEFRIVLRDGEVRWIRRRTSAVQDSAGRVVRVIGTAVDVTELRRTREYAETKNRMEAVGRLAGGVAHDFNNLLTAIMGEAEMLAEDLSGDADRLSAVQEIMASSRRAADLTRQLLAFSRQQVFDLQVLDVNALIRRMEKMLNRLLGEDVELVTVLAADLGAVRADAGQIEQVIMNLAVNARDAMPHGGVLRIESCNLDVTAEMAAAHEGLRPGAYVAFSARDTGEGMSDEVRDHVFEPFFTTKAPGHGTGLGLATVHGIVKQSGGYIILESRRGIGTSFDVLLPRVAAIAQTDEVNAEPAPTRSATETILLVEDETAVRRVIRRVLETYGYKVLEASSGEQALSICKAHSGDIDCVLADLVMPKMNGLQTIEALRALRPGVSALLMSGYANHAISEETGLEMDERVQKPFTPAGLARKLRAILDKRAIAG